MYTSLLSRYDDIAMEDEPERCPDCGRPMNEDGICGYCENEDFYRDIRNEMRSDY